MNACFNRSLGERGFTMTEVIISALIVTFVAVAFLMWQKTTWTQTKLTNRRMIASQVLEKQIEARRMVIALDPTANFNAFKTISGKDTIITDNTTSPPIKVEWKIYDTLKAPNGDAIKNVVSVKLVASWGSGKFDSLKLWTNISQNF